MIQEQPPFFANYFCIIPNTDLAFVAISKNAVTFLKRVAYYNADNIWKDENIWNNRYKKQSKGILWDKKITYPEENNHWLKGFFHTHDKIGYTEESPFLVRVENMKEYERDFGKKIKFAIWRDPVKRIESTFRLFCLKKNTHNYFNFLGVQKIDSFDFFMDFLEFEWKKTYLPLYQDEHIRRQVDYYQPSDVDFILPIEKMHDFLAKNGAKFITEQSNKTQDLDFKITNPQHLERIKNHYEKDYLIELNY